MRIPESSPPSLPRLPAAKGGPRVQARRRGPRTLRWATAGLGPGPAGGRARRRRRPVRAAACDRATRRFQKRQIVVFLIAAMPPTSSTSLAPAAESKRARGPLKKGPAFYEKVVTSGNQWGFPTPKLPPYTPPPPPPAPAPRKVVPWYQAFCDARWLASVRGRVRSPPTLALAAALRPNRPGACATASHPAPPLAARERTTHLPRRGLLGSAARQGGAGQVRRL